MPILSRTIILVFPWLMAASALEADTKATVSPGALVQKAEAAKPADLAGMKAGDVVLSWERLASPPANPEPSRGDIRTIWDWHYILYEEASRGPVRLSVRRGGETLSFEFAAEGWGLDVIPVFEDASLARYLDGRSLINDGKLEEGLACWDALLRAPGLDRAAQAWLLHRKGLALHKAKKWGEAGEAYGRALGLASDPDLPMARFLLYASLASTQDRLKEFDKARESYDRQRELSESRWGDSLNLAWSLGNLGNLAFRRGDMDTAETMFTRALDIRTKVSPGSLDVAGSLNNLGVLSWNRGNLDKAAEYYRASIAIKERLSPVSLDLAATLNNLGIISQLRGNLSEAETHYKASLAIKEKLAPDSEDVAYTLNNLGVVAWDRGDLVTAEARYKQARAVYEKIDPKSPDVAVSLNNLGLLAWERGDLDRAEALQREALAIRREVAPESLDVAYSLNNLGLIARAKGDLKGAVSLYRESLALRKRLAPESLDTARCMMNLGNLLDEMGDAEEGLALVRESLALMDKIAPENLTAGKALVNLGRILEKKGEAAEAERLYGKALDLFSKWAPGSTLEAEAHYYLGALLADGGRLRPALDHLLAAVAALEAQKLRWGGGEESLERFSVRYGTYFQDLMEIQLRLNLKDDAFNTLERYRARVLLSMLAERDLDFSKDAPAELLQEQRTAGIQYDKTQEELAAMNPGTDPEKAKAAAERIMALREQRREVREKIRNASPGLALLQDPEPLTADQAREALEPGTLFLSYSVSKSHTLLLSLLNGKLNIHHIPVARRDLEASIRRYRALLSDPGSSSDAWASTSRTLFDLLLKPAEKEIKKARRILLSPDGPLHILPFSTLKNGKNRYLVELKPLTQVSSATVYLELKRKGKPAPGPLAAFGDPVYAGAPSAGGDGKARAAMTRGDFQPLPFTRREVEALKGLFPDRILIFLGKQATEEALRDLPAGTSMVHLAAHAFVDERFPLDSGLVMTIPETLTEGGANGILQAWEIFEQVRMDADLVTLSACQTGLGKEMGGEGLIGLTRAFQYAGARSVLSTLWSVADESTAQFMKTFYGHLKAGKGKAEALRLAQLSFIRGSKHERDPSLGPDESVSSRSGRRPRVDSKPETRDSKPDLSHPFYWAPFVLNGE